MTCENCPYKGRPRVGSEGDPAACKYVLVGEAPAYDEVRQGRPFAGKTGRLLDAFLKRIGIERSDCYITNALKCQLPRNKEGVDEALSHCRGIFLEELARVNTGASVALMGAHARNVLYPNEYKQGILVSRGWRKYGERDIYVMAHPAFYMYNPEEAPMLLKDLRRIKRGRLPPISTAVCVLEAEKLEEFLASLHRRPVSKRDFVAYDLETDQVDFMRDRILCMSISPEVGTAYIIPDSLLYQDGHEWVTTGKSRQWWERFLSDPRYLNGSYLRPNFATVATLREIFAVPGYRWAAHNSKFDMRFLRHLGVENVRCDLDTIVAHYALDERKGGHSLKAVTDDYFDVGDYEVDLFNYITKKSARYSAVPRRVLYQYNAMDTELTLRLAYALEAELKEQDLWKKPFLFPMMAAIPMLLDAELAGVLIDWEGLERIDKEEIEPELQKVAKELRDISGHPDLNPLSSKRVIGILYDEMGFPVINVRTRAAGKRIHKRSSQIAVLDGWAKMQRQGTLPVSDKAWQFAERLRHYRHLRKMRGSYIRKWKNYRGTDDRVHTSFLLRGTVTGRLASKDPPMQTIPSKKVTDRWGPLVANVHIPQPGWKFIYADYSQAELRALACLSGDKFMLQTFRDGKDYHSEVAVAAYGPDFTRDERQHCKRLTFGWAFGGNVKELALDALQFEGPVAERFAHEWDLLFEDAVKWRESQGDLMQKQGYVESVFGRRRRYVLLTPDNVGKARRVAINAPIQSVISDLTLISAVRLHAKYRHTDYARVILLIHDSATMEVRDDKVEEVRKVMKQVMMDTAAEIFPQIPFVADTKVGVRLGDLT